MKYGNKNSFKNDKQAKANRGSEENLRKSGREEYTT